MTLDDGPSFEKVYYTETGLSYAKSPELGELHGFNVTVHGI